MTRNAPEAVPRVGAAVVAVCLRCNADAGDAMLIPSCPTWATFVITRDAPLVELVTTRLPVASDPDVIAPVSAADAAETAFVTVTLPAVTDPAAAAPDTVALAAVAPFVTVNVPTVSVTIAAVGIVMVPDPLMFLHRSPPMPRSRVASASGPKPAGNCQSEPLPDRYTLDEYPDPVRVNAGAVKALVAVAPPNVAVTEPIVEAVSPFVTVADPTPKDVLVTLVKFPLFGTREPTGGGD